MSHSSLFAISPVDGRYAHVTKQLELYFSERALIRTRLMVEVEYLIALRELPLQQLAHLPKENFEALRELYLHFDDETAVEIKTIEKRLNHDVKSVEIYLREQLGKYSLDEAKEFVHFALTSQDINNTSFPIMLRGAIEAVYRPFLRDLINDITHYAESWLKIPMLAKTHGQPASPTSLGKEMYVFAHRLQMQMRTLEAFQMYGKFGGATGNFNAHFVAYPEVDWVHFAESFLKDKLHLTRIAVTTQIDTYDHFAELFDLISRINTILIDFSRDMWSYISMRYFEQRIVKDEVGSSAMPHKVNPIQFENAEGNLGIANSLLHHLARKLPVSRLQRDLTDSTVIRNIGVPIAHSLIALTSFRDGLSRVHPNVSVITQDLEKNWVVVAEGIQTVLRREGYANAYDRLKEITRKPTPPNQEEMEGFIETLDVPQAIKDELKKITPFSYVGILPVIGESHRV